MEGAVRDGDARFLLHLLSGEDRLLLESVRRFVDKEVMPVRRELEAAARGDPDLIDELWKKMGSLGLQGLFLPEEAGGSDHDSALTTALVAEELGRGDASLFCMLQGGILVMRPAVRAGNEEIVKKFGPRFADPREPARGCPAWEDAGDEAAFPSGRLWGMNIIARARHRKGEWEVEGDKVWCVNSDSALLYMVLCTTDPRKGEEGAALLYLEGGSGGLERKGSRDKGGLRGASFGDLSLRGAVAPFSWRAAGPGRDAQLFLEDLALARLLDGASAVGIAQGSFEEVLAFTSDRVAAGKPIRQHSVAAHILADVAMGIREGRDVYVTTACMLDRPREYGPAYSPSLMSRASAAKLVCCRAAVEATNRVMELMGSYGYVSDYHVEKYWRNAKVVQLLHGGEHGAVGDVVRGYYDFDPLHPNPLYESMRGAGKE